MAISFRRSLILVASIIAGVVPGTLFAQAPAIDADTMFRQLDINQDGRLSLDEAGPNARPMYERIFEMAGKPATGSVSRAEFQQVFERHRAGAGNRPMPMPGTPPAPMPSPPPGATPTSERSPSHGTADLPPVLRLADTNSDRKLSRNEWSRLMQLFNRWDTNKDGELDMGELQAAASGNSAAAANSDNASSSSSATRRSELNSAPSATNSSSPTVYRGWVVSGRGDNPTEGQMQIEVTVVGNRVTGREVGTNRAPPGGLGAGTWTMSGDGRSGNLDADCTEGPNQGRHYLGIYEIQGNTLRWCVSNRERQRPDTMATDRGNYLMILDRVAAN
jgi:uncharacterized protein (TIGR03067 family)